MEFVARVLGAASALVHAVRPARWQISSHQGSVIDLDSASQVPHVTEPPMLGIGI